jgi:hypothetical protein
MSLEAERGQVSSLREVTKKRQPNDRREKQNQTWICEAKGAAVAVVVVAAAVVAGIAERCLGEHREGCKVLHGWDKTPRLAEAARTAARTEETGQKVAENLAGNRNSWISLGSYGGRKVELDASISKINHENKNKKI